MIATVPMQRSAPFMTWLRTVITLGCLLSVLSSAYGGKVVLRIRAGNPIEKPQKVEIKSNLPPRAREGDILSLGGLDLGYDVKNDIYYVHKEIELGPNEVTVFDVEINDIWQIPAQEIEAMAQRAGDLSAKLEDTDYRSRSEMLKQAVIDRVDDVRAQQEEAAIGPGVKPIQHIRVYEANLEAFDRVRRDVGHLENLVLGTGQDPGPLVGTVAAASPRPEPEEPEGGYKTAVYRLTVQNTSPQFKRPIPLKQNLPLEIKARDVLDPVGLFVGVDPQTGGTYVYARGLELEANEQKLFEIKIRDKWNINEPRIDTLDAGINALLKRVISAQKYGSLEDSLRDLLGQLQAIRAESGPESLSPEYIAFYRDQGARLDLIEERLNRIEAGLRPLTTRSELGFDLEPPSPKTTWLLIYIILGFLAVISLVFFFRWYGRSKAEKMEV